MLGPGLGALAVVTAYASVARGQSTWPSNQVDTTLCQWQQPRAAVVQDTVYMDGGRLWWLPGFDDGTLGPITSDDNPLGLVYTLNFSKPFNTTQNITALFNTISKAPAGSAANNLAPNYYDGAMLANNDEWVLYGGLLKKTSGLSDPDADEALAYQKYQYGPQRDSFEPGFAKVNLPVNMTRYIAYGGAASAPSENKAWYFSGMHSPSFGPIYEAGTNLSQTAVDVSNTLITLNMSVQGKESFTNDSLPSDIPGRANPELVWVPVGAQGILVALGGVVLPSFISPTRTISANITESEAQSPGFMSTINVYDVAGNKWYNQQTVDGPGQLTRGCAVVATAQDRSSFNIYYYGGYDGLKETSPHSDDVWILSLPSFTWTKIAGSKQGRAGHKCFMPYPDQMMVIGGSPTIPDTVSPLTCLTEPIRLFNVSSGAWMTSYDPAKYSNYSVPSGISDKIGGSATGGATATAPSPSGFASTGLAQVFATPYPTSKLTRFYPYASAAPANNTNPNTPAASDQPSGGGVPAFLPPVLGVVLGLVFLTMIAVLILLWRRRRLFKARMSDTETEDTNGHRIMSWMRGQTLTSEAKAPTVTTSDELSSSPADVESIVVPRSTIVEAMNTEVQRPPVELDDTSPRAELHDTPVSHIDVLNRYSRLGDNPVPGFGFGTLNNPSSYSSSTQQIDHASSLSRSTASRSVAGMTASSPSPQPPTPQLPSAEPSPPPPEFQPDANLLANLGTGTGTTGSGSGTSATVASSPTITMANRNTRVLSGISNLSERDRAHLRQVSDTTVSSVTTGAGGDRILSPSVPIVETPLESPGASSQRTILAISPPTVGITEEAEDYLDARSSLQRQHTAGTAAGTPTSPLRRSVFTESREDMNDTSRRGGGPSAS
ncbi:hypothetical protein B0T26DRAFT_757823 [Lasiosphaeria miniovina]|uniref:Kelch repeat-containing protein n=1 Tax=Lasiosphaeria miniovina TaxID=1954250 RepID=A0AA39ZQJ1_9PEZI|nr:uncharacterized protein B0T26DRAFT_757823 [Lasiosphaeria miniovina]KAK0701845.1 hypothetical protein B0T26DRAFT_757823 [Lasiosphaeria miniovina]